MTAVGIVTGAGRGIGAACAARLVNDVDVLILADRDAPAIEAAIGLVLGQYPLLLLLDSFVEVFGFGGACHRLDHVGGGLLPRGRSTPVCRSAHLRGIIRGAA